MFSLLFIKKFNLLNDKLIAFIFILLVTTIYMHPIFFGMVDTPIDIRNIQMYPWKYYNVDKKVKKIVLWEHNSFKNKTVNDREINEQVLKIQVPSLSTVSSLFTPALDELLLSKQGNLKDLSYYFSFNFKPIRYDSPSFEIGILLVNKVTNGYLNPSIVVYPANVEKNDEITSWHTAYIPLNNVISVKDLNLYNIQLIAKNKNKNKAASLYLKDLRIVCEDFSEIPKVHNYFINDLIQWFTPAREYFSESIKKAKLPFWNNHTLTGGEFIAEPQVGFFHPFYFLCYLIFDHFTAHSIITFVSFLLCGIGAYLLARFWGLSFGASLLTSIVYMFHPFNVTWFSYEHMLMNSATLPFVLIAYEKSIKESKIINKYLLLSALLLGLIFISGHLQIVYYTVIFFFLFVAFRFSIDAFIWRRNYLKHFFSTLFISSIAIMIGAIVLVPFLTLFQGSHRVAYSEASIKDSSIAIEAFLGLLFPYYKGYPAWPNFDESIINWGFFKNYVYFGLLPFLLSLFSIKVLFKNKLTIFFFLTITFSVLISVGSPLFFMIKDFVPGFKQLQHYRFLEVYSFCVPFLAGIGFQVFLNLVSFLKENIKVLIVSIVVLVSTIDLMYYSSYFVTWSDKKKYKPLYKDSALEFLVRQQKKSSKLFRILPFTVHNIGYKVAEPNTLQPYNLEEASGYSSLISKDIYSLFVYVQTKDPNNLYTKEIIKLFNNTNIPYPIYNFKSKILDLLNIRYFLVPNIVTLKSNDTEKVFSGDCVIYENKNYLPRAFFVPTFKVIESSKETIVELDSESFNPRNEVILMVEPPVIARRVATEQSDNVMRLPRRGFASSRNDIEFLKYEPENITLKVTVDMSGFLVLGHNLNNNWKVKINHKENKHFQANLIQRAVYIPQAGEYSIEFYYYPILFFIGFGISCFAIFILICLALILKYKNKISIAYKDGKSYKEPDKIKISV